LLTSACLAGTLSNNGTASTLSWASNSASQLPNQFFVHSPCGQKCAPPAQEEMA